MLEQRDGDETLMSKTPGAQHVASPRERRTVATSAAGEGAMAVKYIHDYLAEQES